MGPHIAPVPLSWYLLLSVILFAIGIAGFIYRKSIITVFMSIELMLNAVNLTFIAFSYQLKQVDGQIYAFFVMVVAGRKPQSASRLFSLSLRIGRHFRSMTSTR